MMVNIFYIKMILSLVIFIFVSVYLILTLSIRRFRRQKHMFILNICLTIITASVFLIIYYIILYFGIQHLYAPHICIVFHYIYNIASIGVPFGFVTFSIHRLRCVIYFTKHFFKTKRWIVICISSQWIIKFLVSMPFVFRNKPACTYELWMVIYTYMIAVFIPSLVNIIVNFLIFTKVRASTCRVQPQIINTVMNSTHIHRAKMSRRDISVLKQMIFVFLIFMGGWSPIYLTMLLHQFIDLNPLVFQFTELFSELCLLIVVLYLFINNFELRQYLLNKIRLFFRWQ